MNWLVVSLLLVQSQNAPKDWEPLFNGKNYAGWKFWIPNGPEETFLVRDGCMAIRGHKAGIAYTQAKHRNYELSFQWRFVRPEGLGSDAEFHGNSGVFLHLSRILKDWPRSVEVEGKYAEMGKLVPHEKVKGEFTDDPVARRSAMRPVGEWNTTVVRCREGNIRVMVNGKQVAQGQMAAEEKTNQWEGSIGFQAQGSDIDYREIRIRELK